MNIVSMRKVLVKRVGVGLGITFVALVFANCCLGERGIKDSGKNNEFYTEFRYSEAKGLGYEEGVTRRDPSDVIKVGANYYVWYTKTSHGSSGYDATVWYATSPDGKTWTERGEAVGRGGKGAWDEHSVFTPNILVAENKYYLFYTGVPEPFTNDNGGPRGTKTAIGVAVSESADGPWAKLADNPVLLPGNDKNDFDSHRVDDACLIVRYGRYRLYYKGRQMGLSPGETKMGVAIAARPAGPYVKSELNPVIKSGHEVLVWPYREGVAALIGPTGPEKNTIQYAPDGLRFSVKAHIKKPPPAPGAYRPDAFTNTRYGQGITWGISMGSYRRWPYLVRFDCDTGLKK